jgi:hypothetical protein
MADFLNRLAARALGAVPLAEPVIPTRFSTGTELNAFLASEPALQPSRPGPETSPENSEDRLHPLHFREADPSSEARVARPSSPFQDLDEAPHLPRSQRPPAFPPQAPPPQPYAEREAVQPSSEHAELRKQHLAAAINPTLDAVEKPATNRPQTTSPAPVAFAIPHPTRRRTPLAEPARSPALQHPELPQASRPAPPTVHVSIGRIEVRAEIASPMPTAPVQRPRRSTLSLDQFLKQVSGSTR